MSLDRKKRDVLKEFFETGDRPTETQFSSFIDSGINQKDDGVFIDHTQNNNPRVGIGTETPTEKLDVNGNITVQGNIYGKHKSDVLRIQVDQDQNIDKNAPSVSFWGVDFPSNHAWEKPGQLRFDAGDGIANPNVSNADTGGFTFVQHLPQENNSWQTLLEIKKNGDVGVGTSNPQNKLHIHNDDGIDTGLRLPQGSGADKVLTSDNSGNASWKDLNDITNGLWKKDGNDIINGNNGSVGIGVNSVAAGQKLHVYGNSRLENVRGELNLTDVSHGNNASLALEQKKTTDLGLDGSVRYEQMWGNKYGAHMHTNATDGSIDSANIGTENGQLWLSAGSGSPIIFFPGDTDWMNSGGMIDNNGNWFLNGKTYIGDNLGNPNNATPSNYMLDVDGNSNFKGDVKIKGQDPIVVKRFKLNDLTNGELKEGNTYFTTADYGAAVVVGFEAESGKLVDNNFLNIYAYTEIKNNKWCVRADYSSVNIYPEKWTVTIMFIRKEISKWDITQ